MNRHYRSIVVLTGAGVSAESGLKTFRDQNGLWENHRIEDVCTPEAFARNATLVHSFYNARRAQLIKEAKPNPAHHALARFERGFAGRFTLVTQNVDNLHEQAGSTGVLHMHGQLLKARCNACGGVVDCHGSLSQEDACSKCQSRGQMRPDIVWFGEMPFFMDQIERALWECDLFVAIGTSGQVYPAAGFVQLANAAGAHTVELNLEASQGARQFAECIEGPASRTVAAFFAQLV